MEKEGNSQRVREHALSWSLGSSLFLPVNTVSFPPLWQKQCRHPLVAVGMGEEVYIKCWFLCLLTVKELVLTSVSLKGSS